MRGQATWAWFSERRALAWENVRLESSSGISSLKGEEKEKRRRAGKKGQLLCPSFWCEEKTRGRLRGAVISESCQRNGDRCASIKTILIYFSTFFEYSLIYVIFFSLFLFSGAKFENFFFTYAPLLYLSIMCDFLSYFPLFANILFFYFKKNAICSRK